MSTEPMPAAIAEAIGAIMVKVRNVEKHGENKFHNYKFARVEDLMFQVQPALAEAGLVITQDEIHHEVASDALMLATYAFSLSHKSGVTWGPIRQTGMSSLRNTKGGFDDKALNKCHTAARKYFILGLFQVPAGDLPDVDSEEDKAAAPARALAKKDYGPSPMGGDFPGAEGSPRVSSYAAKKDGKGTRLNELRNEIWGLESMVAVGAWTKERSEEIKTFPEGWRKILREDLDEQKHTIQRSAEADLDGFRGEGAEPLANGAGALV